MFLSKALLFMIEIEDSKMPEMIQVDSRIFNIDAVKRACFELLHVGSFDIKQNESDNYVLAVTARDGLSIVDIKSLFNKALVENQLRLDTEKQFKVIRELIIAQAFAPCDNLDEVINELHVDEC